jgi:hypothetical protein
MIQVVTGEPDSHLAIRHIALRGEAWDRAIRIQTEKINCTVRRPNPDWVDSPKRVGT